MDTTYAREYRDLYKRHWWWRAREQYVLDELRRRRPVGRWGHILDVGCGGGVFFPALSILGDVEGIEPDAALVDRSDPYSARIHVRPFDATFRPPHDYGLILMLDVLEHMSEPEAALAHAVTLLERGGTLVVTVPAFMLLWTQHDVLNRHHTRYTRPRIERLARAAGFDVLTCRYFYHWLVPAKLATRVMELVHRRAPRAPRVPAQWINSLLYLVSRAEQRLSRSLSLPFGSSVLLVARKPTNA
ncbi:MAG TPA: class I SAM-dependent methyltransferase [Gemmatimonadaceae bacterium]|nr:class I SAM-dependent methyltransferase [Gemmatimonadaceae bacterium]